MFQPRHVLAAALSVCPIVAQSISSNIVGVAVDPADAVVPGAEIRLVEQASGAERTTRANDSGLFRLNNLPPGLYQLSIAAKGFKTQTQSGLQLASSETRDLGRIVLTIGSVDQTISVGAQVTPVQTASSEKSSLIDGKQLTDVAIKGRDMFSFMRLIPGVVDTQMGRDVTAPGAIGGLTINGNNTGKNFTVDGITSLDTGCNNCVASYVPNLDTISEIRVLTSNYQAEFGRGSGGQISVVTKSGGREFHGTGWWTHRHEQFTANSFFNNQTGLPRARYRYNVAGFSAGGPVMIPRLFNTQRQRLFFFASQEYTRQLESNPTQTRYMPTALERNGDFSQSVDGRGALIVIRDPAAGNTPFASNRIPATRANRYGKAMLDFFPLPNFNPAPGTIFFNQANFQQNTSGRHPRRNDLVRGDFYLTSKVNGYVRYVKDTDDQLAVFRSTQFDGYPVDHPNPGFGVSGTINYTISPTLVNEATMGMSDTVWGWFSPPGRQPLNSLLGNPPRLFPLPPSPESAKGSCPVNCPSDYLPNFSFGAVPVNTPSFAQPLRAGVEYANYNTIWSFTDNLSKVAGKHNWKFGTYIEFNQHNRGNGIGYLGTYNFAADANNPLNTGNGFANSFLGNYTSYSQERNITVAETRYWLVEWYAQDNWRVSRKLTLDLGVRFYVKTPKVDINRTWSTFDPNLYSAAKMPRIYRPGFNTANQRVAVDPATGVSAPVAAIGLFVPGTGDPGAGLRVAGQDGNPLNTYTQRWLMPAPRLGFAYDVFGNGRTAIRGGFGVFFDQLDGNQFYNMGFQAPVNFSATTYYGNVDSLASAVPLVGPQDITSLRGRIPHSQVRNASFGIQQNLGFDMVLDSSYVGSWSLNQVLNGDVNPVPLGARFDPRNTDPTRPGAVLPEIFLRPRFPGYSSVTERQFSGGTNYHSLQVSLKRRFSKGLSVGAAYTWSKSLGVAAFEPLVGDNRVRNYGPLANDRRHVGAVDFIYEIPGLDKSAPRAIRPITNGWTLSGIGYFSTGAPFTPGFSTAPALDITGTPSIGARIDVVGDPKSTPTVPGTQFNTAAFARPAVGTLGSGGVNYLYHPAFSNWDLTLAKAIPMGLGEGRSLKLRFEAYNVFNNTQFSAVGTAAQFNSAGAQINQSFGRYTATRPPRILSLAMRFQF